METQLITIKSIKKVVSTSLRYDIQTKKNHNFFANNILVHNSLGIIYYHNDWNVATRGSFKSEQAIWAKNYLDKYIDKSLLNKGFTYLAEIIYPENRIVIPYDFAGLVLLGIYNDCGEELSYTCCQYFAGQAKFKIASIMQFNSIAEIVNICKNLPSHKEGFVVRFANGYRVKIKGDKYIRVHRLISNVTPCRIWECMINGDNMNNIRLQLPEELRTDFDNIVNILNNKFEAIIKELSIAYEATKHLSDKDLGLAIKSGSLGHSTTITHMLFPCRKMELLAEAYKGGSKMRKKVFNAFYPKGNKLDGYIPTTSVNRFIEELEVS
jgi:RNA ligase